MGASKNIVSVRLVWRFSPIEAIFRRNTRGISRGINDDRGKYTNQDDRQ